MGSKLFDELVTIRDKHDPALVYFMNTGDVIVKDAYSLDILNGFNSEYSASYIKTVLKKAADMYIYDGKFNRLNMTIDMGLVYYKEDVDDKNRIIGHAQPINNIVFYKTSNVESYLDNEKTNKYNYCEDVNGAFGFINYNDFSELMEKEGLIVSAPETFSEFRDSVLCGEKFKVTIEADLREKTYPKRLVRKY